MGGGDCVAGVAGREVGGEALEDLDVISSGLALAVVPQRLDSPAVPGGPAVQDGPAQRGYEFVPLGADGRRLGTRQQRGLGGRQRGAGIPVAQGGARGEEVGVDVGPQAVRLGQHDLLAELGAEPVHLGARGRRVAVLAVELERQLVGGQPAGMQSQQGEQFGAAQGEQEHPAVEHGRRPLPQERQRQGRAVHAGGPRRGARSR